jgi:phenylacetate-CoA ligase
MRMKAWQLQLYYSSPPLLQNVFISAERLLRLPVELGGTFRHYRRRFAEMQHWSRNDLEAWQLERLQDLLAHAYANVPAYRQLYDEARVKPADVRTLADVQKLPIITKQQVRADRQAFIARNAKQYKPVELNTSGTTGSPFQFYTDRRTEAVEWAYFWRHKSWGGASLFEPMISLGGRVVVPLSQQRPPFWRFNWAEHVMWLSTFHMTPANLDLYVEQVRRSGLRFMRGYPSNLFIFAQHLQKREIHLPMQAIFSGSEPLYTYVRELVEDRFRCKIYDWYGVSERVVTASQCDQHRHYHVHMENCLVEILRGDEPAAPDELGEIVATCLSNYAMPLIRYRTGDASVANSEACPCGRGLATIKQVQTKWEDILTTADGRLISPSILTHPFKPILGVEKSQIVQEDVRHLTVKIVAGPLFDEAQRALLVEGMQGRVGAEMQIHVETVADIPKGPSGKFRWVISKVPTAFNEQLAKEYAG